MVPRRFMLMNSIWVSGQMKNMYLQSLFTLAYFGEKIECLNKSWFQLVKKLYLTL